MRALPESSPDGLAPRRPLDRPPMVQEQAFQARQSRQDQGRPLVAREAPGEADGQSLRSKAPLGQQLGSLRVARNPAVAARSRRSLKSSSLLRVCACQSSSSGMPATWAQIEASSCFSGQSRPRYYEEGQPRSCCSHVERWTPLVTWRSARPPPFFRQSLFHIWRETMPWRLLYAVAPARQLERQRGHVPARLARDPAQLHELLLIQAELAPISVEIFGDQPSENTSCRPRPGYAW